MQHGHAEGTKKPIYNIVFVVLAVMTVIEILASGVDFPGKLLFVVLGALALGKAGLVMAYYMHLKDDPPLYTWIFAATVLGAAALLISLQMLTGYK